MPAAQRHRSHPLLLSALTAHPSGRIVGGQARRVAPMKIADVQAVPLAIPMRPFEPPSPWQTRMRKQVLVRVVSDEGAIGLGEAFALGGPLAVANVIEESLRPLLVGQDPTRIE